MEPLRTKRQQVSEPAMSRRAMLTGMALAALAPVGCLGKYFANRSAIKAAPQGRLVSAWQNNVTYAPDTTRGGAVFPGLLARVYLFGPLPAPLPDGKPDTSDPSKGLPYLGDGTLTIFIYDATPRGSKEPKLTDVVDLGPESLKQFAKTDFVGPGYTIFCPWFQYRPDVTHVFINLEYTSSTGEKFYHQSGTMSVNHAETMERAKKGLPAYIPDQAPPGQ